jgi:uncharacterized membrane protein YeaQ/YmgE (transglycosylase-associated protein family)
MLHVVWSIVVGFIVGLIASAIMHTHLGFVGTTLLGIVGSVIGGLFDCTTVLKATGRFKISSRWIYPVHHWCDTFSSPIEAGRATTAKILSVRSVKMAGERWAKASAPAISPVELHKFLESPRECADKV